MNPRITGAVLLFFMAFASMMALALKPRQIEIENSKIVILEKIIPKTIGVWDEFDGGYITMPDPQQQKVLKDLYTDVVSRSYRNRLTGHIIMLVIAYGADQSKQSQIHLPEVCYPAQGFQISNKHRAVILTPKGSINVTRMTAISGERHEPITYWIRIADRIVAGVLDQKLAIVAEGIRGVIADGTLIRISSISKFTEKEYAIQDEFANELFKATDSSTQEILMGNVVKGEVASR